MFSTLSPLKINVGLRSLPLPINPTPAFIHQIREYWFVLYQKTQHYDELHYTGPLCGSFLGNVSVAELIDGRLLLNSH